MMKSFGLKCIPAVLHCILTFVFLQLMLKSTNNNLVSQFTLVCSILACTNAIAIGWIAKGKLNILGQQIWIYCLFSLLIGLVLYSSGQVELTIETLLNKSIIIHFVLLSYSLLSCIVGTVLGVAGYHLVRLYMNRTKKEIAV